MATDHRAAFSGSTDRLRSARRRIRREIWQSATIAATLLFVAGCSTARSNATALNAPPPDQAAAAPQTPAPPVQSPATSVAVLRPDPQSSANPTIRLAAFTAPFDPGSLPSSEPLSPIAESSPPPDQLRPGTESPAPPPVAVQYAPQQFAPQQFSPQQFAPQPAGPQFVPTPQVTAPPTTIPQTLALPPMPQPAMPQPTMPQPAMPQSGMPPPAAQYPAAPEDEFSGANADLLPVDLPTALRLTNANNPTIALARERVDEAYAAERIADVAWLPNLQGGADYNRHDGRIQTTQGPIITVSKQNLFINGGATLDWNTSDILFGRLVAERLVAAQSAAAQATSFQIQLSAAQAYLDLLQAYGALAVNADTLSRTEEMLRNATAADRAGLTVTAGDINRARAEYDLRREERLQIEGDIGIVSARLAHILLLRPTVVLRPNDMKIVPITLVPFGANPDGLVTAAWANRPEVQEGRALSAAAMERVRQARLAPLMPHVDVTYFGGEFGGGVNSQMTDFGARGDGEVDLYWQLQNLGAGDVAQTHLRQAQFSEANFQLAEVRAQIGEEVTAAYRQVEANRRSLDSSEQAVRQALETWRRLRAASFGMAGQQRLYDPLEPLIAERDLQQARTSYLDAVIGYNKAQFQLYWAMGQPPMQGPINARAIPVDVPVVPEPRAEEIPPPQR